MNYLTIFIKQTLSINISDHELKFTIDIALKYFPIDKADYLKQLLNKEEDLNSLRVVEVFSEILSETNSSSIMAFVVEGIVEMVITQRAISAIIKLVTPESIFAKR